MNHFLDGKRGRKNVKLMTEKQERKNEGRGEGERHEDRQSSRDLHPLPILAALFCSSYCCHQFPCPSSSSSSSSFLSSLFFHLIFLFVPRSFLLFLLLLPLFGTTEPGLGFMWRTNDEMERSNISLFLLFFLPCNPSLLFLLLLLLLSSPLSSILFRLSTFILLLLFVLLLLLL